MKSVLSMLAVIAVAIGGSFATAADLETRNYSVGDFSRIENHTSGSIELIQGSKTSVVAKTEADLFEYLEIETSGDRLILSVKGQRKSFFSWSDPFNNKKLHFIVTTPTINAVALNGSGDLTADSIKSDSLQLSIHGSGNASVKQVESDELKLGIYGSGKLKMDSIKASSMESGIHGSGDLVINRLHSESNAFSIHGSGDVRADELEGENLKISIHGSGDIRLPKVKLKNIEGAIHGSGNIKLGGKADTLSISTHGSGDVSTDGFDADKIVIK